MNGYPVTLKTSRESALSVRVPIGTGRDKLIRASAKIESAMNMWYKHT
jgi:hypothetical protein